MGLHRVFLLVLMVLAFLLSADSNVFAKPHDKGPLDDQDFEAGLPDTRMPPGVRERVFVHVPRTHHPNHLGTCVETTQDTVDHYETGGWHLPNGGIKWKLNAGTVPTRNGLTVPAVQTVLAESFQTWADADSNRIKLFLYDGQTAIARPRFDRVNVVMWGKVSAGALAVTYIRYNTTTGEVVDVDTVFNSRLPWAMFDAAGSECQSQPDAYDVKNIAVHEFGHWIGLDDLYNAADRDLTMYGFGAGGELKKRTLGTGDVSGTNAVAP